MSTPPDQFFSRIAGKVNLDRLKDRLVVIVGVGSVGSQIARELAYSGVGNLRLIDGDTLQEPNLIRHALPRHWVGENKAEALTLYLAGEIPTIQVTGLDRHIDHNVSDGELDELLRNADLIVASTDDREAQRRVNACARRLDVTVVSPGLYENDGGEVFIQQDAQDAELPCFSCWDEFRLADAALRGVSALNVDILPVLALTVELCLGVLDWSSVYARHLAPRSDGQLPILFRLTVRDDLVLGIATLDKRSECPVCGQQSSAGPAMWQPSGSRTTSQFLLPAWFDDTDSIPLRLLALVGSIAFAVCPFLIMTHLFQGAGVLQLIIGPVCFVWVFAGLAAVVTTAWAVLGISVESLGRMTRHRSWRGVAVILTLCAMTVLLFRAASTPFSADESTRSAPAETELAVLERIAKGERISDESVDNKDAMIEAAVKLEPSRWFKPCRFGTPVTAATPVKTYKCVTNGVSSTLEYFAEPNEVQRALLKRAWEVGAVRPKATCPDDAPALQEYGLGYVLCFIKHEHLYYAWTNSTGYEVRYTEARFPGFDPGAAQQWWNEANVEVSAHWIPRY